MKHALVVAVAVAYVVVSLADGGYAPEAIAAVWSDGFFILPRLPALDMDAADARAADADAAS